VGLIANVSRSVPKALKVGSISKRGVLTNRRSVRCDTGTAVLFLKYMLGVLEVVLGMALRLLLHLWIESRHLRINRTDTEAG
jgi:hypothetical protein